MGIQERFLTSGRDLACLAQLRKWIKRLRAPPDFYVQRFRGLVARHLQQDGLNLEMADYLGLREGHNFSSAQRIPS